MLLFTFLIYSPYIKRIKCIDRYIKKVSFNIKIHLFKKKIIDQRGDL